MRRGADAAGGPPPPATRLGETDAAPPASGAQGHAAGPPRDNFDTAPGSAIADTLCALPEPGTWGSGAFGLPLGPWSFAPAGTAHAPAAGASGARASAAAVGSAVESAVGGPAASAMESAAKGAAAMASVAAAAPRGDALVRSLSEAVAECIRAHPASEDARIADKLASFVFTDTAQDFVAAVRRGERPLLDELGAGALEKAFREDPSRPQHLYMLTMNGRSSWGGAVMLEKDIFPEGFYRTRALETTAPGGLHKEPYTGDQAALLFEQPYFRWQGDGYAFHLGSAHDNANVRLVEHLAAQGGGQVTLWRGTREEWDTAAELLTPGDDGRLPAGSMSRFGDHLASVMTTPDRKIAEGWANPALVSLSLSADELTSLARQGLVYAGIEYEYLEVALLYERDPASGRGHDTLQRMQRVPRSPGPAPVGDAPVDA